MSTRARMPGEFVRQVPAPAGPEEGLMRWAEPGDAEGVVELLRQIYGETYPLRQFYDPDFLRTQWQEGRLTSLLVEDGPRVVAHYALKRNEIALGLVLPERRGEGLASRMREQLEARARALGLDHLAGTPVASHSYTQRLYDRQGYTPTGLLVEAGCVSIAGVHELRQEHLVLYFKYLQSPRPRALWVPEWLQALVAEVYSGLGVAAELQRPQGGKVGFTVEEFNPGRPLYRFPGASPWDEQAAFVDLPLGEAGTGSAWEAVRASGYVFAAVQPRQDRLWLQRRPAALRESEFQLSHPAARRFLNGLQ